MGHNVKIKPRLGQTISPAPSKSNLIYYMWLTFILFSTSLLYIISKESSHQLCVFAVKSHSLHWTTHMCFATTKTIKSLRVAKGKSNIFTDLGFNWDDTCDYLEHESLETLQINKNDLRILQLNIRGIKGKLISELV